MNLRLRSDVHRGFFSVIHTNEITFYKVMQKLKNSSYMLLSYYMRKCVVGVTSIEPADAHTVKHEADA